MRFSSVLTLLGVAQTVVCQMDGGLSAALANNTELSGFRQFLTTQSGLFNSILPSTGIGNLTILVPTNTALEAFYNKTGQQLGSLSVDRVIAILQYHSLAAKLTSSNFTASASQKGLAIPTLLREELYNNRSDLPSLSNQFGPEAAQGNVVFLSKDRLSPAKLKLRQSAPTNVSLRGGLASDATISAVDGVWALGVYQIIDTVLEPPAPCSNTIRSLKATLQGLDTALNRSGLWTALDHSRNVTCLAPNNDAFKAAGNPENSLNSTELQSALLFHTLPNVTYSNFIQDGIVFKSLQGGEVRVSIVNDKIYFNDAMVVSPNVLTNNGLIHVLDKVMSPNGTAPAPTTPTSTSGPSGTSSPSPTQSKQNAAHRAAGSGGGILAMSVALAAVMFLG